MIAILHKHLKLIRILSKPLEKPLLFELIFKLWQTFTLHRQELKEHNSLAELHTNYFLPLNDECFFLF